MASVNGNQAFDTGKREPVETRKRETIMNFFARFAKDESGATAIEYGLVASLIAVAIITAATNVGTGVVNTFDTVSTELQ